MLLIQVLIVFVIEQTIEGRLISPLVLGNELSIHPVTILLVLLTSGKLFGLVGVILGIPVYAAAKVVITHVFEWYTRVSSLYEEEEPIPEAPQRTPRSVAASSVKEPIRIIYGTAFFCGLYLFMRIKEPAIIGK